MKTIHVGEQRPHPSIEGEYDICSIRNGDLVKPSNWTKFVDVKSIVKILKDNCWCGSMRADETCSGCELIARIE